MVEHKDTLLTKVVGSVFEDTHSLTEQGPEQPDLAGPASSKMLD